MIDENLVEIVADLAKLNISDEEKKKYTDQISEVFNYFEKLKELDLREIEPTGQITGLQNAARDDEVHLIYSTEKLLREAPEVEGEQVKIPGVMKGKK